MDKTKVIKKIANLKKIKSIVEIAKFDTLQKLIKSHKTQEHHYEIANISKDVIAFAKNKYNTFSQDENKVFQNDFYNLWIFVTIPSKLIKVSYDRFQQIIKDKWADGDQIITIGDPAIKFAKKNQYSVLASFDDLDNTAKDVVALATKFANYHKYNKIQIVAKTPTIKNKPFVIYPISISEINKKKYKQFKYYYSLSDTIENISNIYMYNIIVGIYQETYRLFYQEKLVRHEASIKNIATKLEILKSNLNKLKRKEETEEIIHVTQIAKSR